MGTESGMGQFRGHYSSMSQLGSTRSNKKGWTCKEEMFNLKSQEPWRAFIVHWLFTQDRLNLQLCFTPKRPLQTSFEKTHRGDMDCNNWQQYHLVCRKWMSKGWQFQIAEATRHWKCPQMALPPPWSGSYSLVLTLGSQTVSYFCPILPWKTASRGSEAWMKLVQLKSV